MYLRIVGATAAVALLLSACGGGGGSTAASAPAAPLPAISLSSAPSKVTLGSPATITWASSNATSCVASDAWSGGQALSGSSAQTPTTAGVAKYTITCTGPGGAASASTMVTIPIPVLKSSYENKAAAAEALGPQSLPAEVRRGNAVAFADFFQDGSYSMITHSLEYDANDPSSANRAGSIHFWKSQNGAWVDSTASILADNKGCLHPRKAIVADFNLDGKPDVFFACHGFDAPPFPGESPVVLLSQADGTYQRIFLPQKGFFHAASAADVDGDGYPDVLVTDNIGAGQPYFLMGGKGGTFTVDMTRLPDNVKYKPIFSVELIDFGHRGKYDAFLGGHEQQSDGNWPATILASDGAGLYRSTARTVLPGLAGYGFPTDIVFANDTIYLSRTIDDPGNFYGGAAIQKIRYPSLISEQMYSSTGARYRSGTSWINWIIASHEKISTMDSMYAVSVPQ